MIALIVAFLIFALVFYLLLRYTRRSVGDDSPLHRRVTYQVTFWQYFTRFDFLSLIAIGVIIIELDYILLVHGFADAKKGWHYLVLLSFIGTSVWILNYLRLLFRLNDQYWELTRDVVVTLDPVDKRITIESPEETVSFTASDVQEIERIGSVFIVRKWWLDTNNGDLY